MFELYQAAWKKWEVLEYHFVYPVTRLNPDAIMVLLGGKCLCIFAIVGIYFKHKWVRFVRAEVMLPFLRSLYVKYMKVADKIQRAVENVPWLYFLTMPCQFAYSMAMLLVDTYLSVAITASGALMLFFMIFLPIIMLSMGHLVISKLSSFLPDILKMSAQNGVESVHKMIMNTLMAVTVMYGFFRLTEFFQLQMWYLHKYPNVDIMFTVIAIGMLVGSITSWIYFSGNRSVDEDMTETELDERLHTIHVCSSFVSLSAMCFASLLCFCYIHLEYQYYIT
jgi:hypothetical protein